MVGGNKGVLSSSSASDIPAASKKMVQSLKEIVSCSELEIYAMLKECNMDPNETVDRLLTQDQFHEVKGKREKTKENKDTTESWSRGPGKTSRRGGRGASERYVGGGRGGSSSNQFASTEPGAYHGNSAYNKKENGTYAHKIYPSSDSHMTGDNMYRQPFSLSDSAPKDTDNAYSSSQPSSFQPAWAGVPGQLSMADIVKMGRPPSKTSNALYQSHRNAQDHFIAPPSAASHHDWHSSQDHVSHNDEWPSSVEEPPAAGIPSVAEEPLDGNYCTNSSGLPIVRTNQNDELEITEVQVEEDGAGDRLDANLVRSASVSSRSVQEDGSSSRFDTEIYNNMVSYPHQNNDFEHDGVEDGGASLSSVTGNLQQLSLQKDEGGVPPEEDDHSVVIPNHLVVQSADCSHLSFGSFRAGIGAGFPRSFTARPLNNDVEEASMMPEASSVGYSDTRNPEYYGDEHFITTSNGSRTGANTELYDTHSVSQPEALILKQENTQAGQENQYAFPPSAPGYTLENSQLLNAAYANSSSQMQHISPFSNAPQAYTNSIPSTMLTSTVQPLRESDHAYSPLQVLQSMPTKYDNVVSSISGSTISMPEGMNVGNQSTSQQTQQTLPTGHILPQHLSMHQYSQPTLPLGHYANMIGYPFLPQSYAYMPSAYQQAFGGNSSYHQSALAAAMLPQFKNNAASINNLSQSAAIASGYGGFGSSNTLNPTAAAGATGTSIGYEDVINSQYKDVSQLLSLQQQSDSSGMWVHGPGSRSGVPASAYYNYQGQQQQQQSQHQQQQQQQQPANFRVGQQQPAPPSSQQFGTHGYPNFYHSQAMEQHQQQQQQNHLRDGSSLSASQGQQQQQPSKQQVQHLWQNNY